MKPKSKWSLRLSSSLISEDTSLSTSRPTPDEKKKYPKHLSMYHEKELKKKREEKKAEIEKAARIVVRTTARATRPLQT